MGERLGNTMTNIVKYKLQKGISLVEALVSTTIVAIGFLAVFQLVNYSVNSIDVALLRVSGGVPRCPELVSLCSVCLRVFLLHRLRLVPPLLKC